MRAKSEARKQRVAGGAAWAGTQGTRRLWPTPLFACPPEERRNAGLRVFAICTCLDTSAGLEPSYRACPTTRSEHARKSGCALGSASPPGALGGVAAAPPSLAHFACSALPARLTRTSAPLTRLTCGRTHLPPHLTTAPSLHASPAPAPPSRRRTTPGAAAPPAPPRPPSAHSPERRPRRPLAALLRQRRRQRRWLAGRRPPPAPPEVTCQAVGRTRPPPTAGLQAVFARG